MKNQINNQEDVKAFVQYLIDNNQLFHFEDDPIDVININDEPVFTPYECDLINRRIAEICDLNLLEVAFEYALEYLCAEDEAYEQAHRNSLTQEQINNI
jgi:hypothetical protein